jgi:hypothetical protein
MLMLLRYLLTPQKPRNMAQLCERPFLISANGLGSLILEDHPMLARLQTLYWRAQVTVAWTRDLENPS